MTYKEVKEHLERGTGGYEPLKMAMEALDKLDKKRLVDADELIAWLKAKENKKETSFFVASTLKIVREGIENKIKGGNYE